MQAMKEIEIKADDEVPKEYRRGQFSTTLAMQQAYELRKGKEKEEKIIREEVQKHLSYLKKKQEEEQKKPDLKAIT